MDERSTCTTAQTLSPTQLPLSEVGTVDFGEGIPLLIKVNTLEMRDEKGERLRPLNH